MTAQIRPERGFVLTRVLPAPRHEVFAAWTRPEHLAWFYNPAMPAPSSPITVDLRVGGVWRQQMVVDEDLQYPTGGVYLEIIPDSRVVFRWGAVGGWPELAEPEGRRAPIVTVELTEAGDDTHLEFTVLFPDEVADAEIRELIDGGTRAGWSATVDRIADSTAITHQPVT